MISKTFIEDDDLGSLAEKVIKERKMDWLANIKLKLVLVSPSISKTVVGKCIKPSHELKYFGKFDYLIEFSEDLWESLTSELKEIVMYHELLHVNITHDKKGNEKHSILDHNIKDFSEIIAVYGIEWFDKLKTIVSSVRNFDTKESGKVKV
ncbi:MAG: putative metallopeptidase [Candidatus Nanoarchaeia archaeon]|jgi:predicted metallopeptidase|nr:putative metallopeptidase [Candidatus Nanoarchaeia archaeon]